MEETAGFDDVEFDPSFKLRVIEPDFLIETFEGAFDVVVVVVVVVDDDDDAETAGGGGFQFSEGGDGDGDGVGKEGMD